MFTAHISATLITCCWVTIVTPSTNSASCTFLYQLSIILVSIILSSKNKWKHSAIVSTFWLSSVRRCFREISPGLSRRGPVYPQLRPENVSLAEVACVVNSCSSSDSLSKSYGSGSASLWEMLPSSEDSSEALASNSWYSNTSFDDKPEIISVDKIMIQQQKRQ